MKQVIIFEVPIYSMKEDIFNNRWKNYFQNNFSNVNNGIYKRCIFSNECLEV